MGHKYFMYPNYYSHENWSKPKLKKENKMTNDQSWEFFIAGVQHHEAKKVISKLKVGQELQMVLMPKNKFDPNAIRLKYVDVMLGFVKGKLSAEVSAFIEVQRANDMADYPICTITELNPDSKPWEWIKVKIGI